MPPADAVMSLEAVVPMARPLHNSSEHWEKVDRPFLSLEAGVLFGGVKNSRPGRDPGDMGIQ